MDITLSFEGRYINGAWTPTSIIAREQDEDPQHCEITRNSDGTYVVESFLLGDETPAISAPMTFQDAWSGLAVVFGIVEP